MIDPPYREVALFTEALKLPAEKQAAYLDEACAGDASLRQRVEAFLLAHEEAGAFLEEPAEGAERGDSCPAVPPRRDASAQSATSAPGATPKVAADRNVRAPGPGGTIQLNITPSEKAGDRIGRYKLLQQIGEGGCGVVYMAEQEEPVRRKVALKVIKLGMDTKNVIARFEAERQALALMDHPNIAKVFDAGATETGRPYFVMELVRGIKITDYCDQERLPTERRLELFVQVCQAIQHAHQKGIIHRDIKPSNILITLRDGVPVPKVIDFGIAKATTDQRLTDKTLFTQFEMFIGTPAYMSPEQAEMNELGIDTRSDIYSLGVLLYELLTGTTPFDAKELMQSGIDEIRRIIREQEPVRPSTRLTRELATAFGVRQSSGALDEAAGASPGPATPNEKRRRTGALQNAGVLACPTSSQRLAQLKQLIPLLRGELDWIVMKALEKDRARRYETANGLARDVERYLADEPVVACPPSQLYRFQKLVRRNKLAFAAASAVAAALAVGLAFSTWQFIAKSRAYRRAVLAEQAQSRLRQQAEADEKKARTEAAKSQQVARFLEDMLAGVGPSVALGRDTTMLREILDKTAQRIHQDLKDQPEVEMELRLTIAETYRQLELWKEMEQMARETLRLAKSRFGDEHRTVAHSLGLLGYAQLGFGHLSEAETLFRQALSLAKKLDDRHPDVAMGLHILALVLFREGRLAEAEAAYREALVRRKKLFGEAPDQGVAISLHDLGLVVYQEGNLAEGENMLREALAMERKLFGNQHIKVEQPLNGLVSLLRSEGRDAEAETLEREGAERSNPETLNELAWRLATSPGATLRYGSNAVAYAEKAVAATSRTNAMYLDTLAAAYAAARQFDQAVSIQTEAIALLRNEEQRKDYASRLRLFESKVPYRDAGVLASRASALLAAGKFAESEPLARECLVLREKQIPDDWSTFNARSMLGGSLLGQKKYADAEPLLLSGYEGMKQREAQIPAEGRARLPEAMARIEQLYELTARPEQAAEWKKRQEPELSKQR
jgi:serine/threonine protein kinase